MTNDERNAIEFAKKIIIELRKHGRNVEADKLEAILKERDAK